VIECRRGMHRLAIVPFRRHVVYVTRKENVPTLKEIHVHRFAIDLYIAWTLL